MKQALKDVIVTSKNAIGNKHSKEIKRILVCYNTDMYSNAITSSAREKLKQNPIEGIEIEFKNVDKTNMKKYLEKLEENKELPDVIYYYENGFKNIDYFYDENGKITLVGYFLNNNYYSKLEWLNQIKNI